jgi:hypothetical protein
MNPELSLDPLMHDIARARAHESVAYVKTFHTCECGEGCVCPMKWARMFRQAYMEELVILKGELIQFAPASRETMRERRVVERNTVAGMECPICYDPLSVGKFCTKVVACEHRFHVKCAKRWFRDPDANTACPMCRHPVIR